MSRTDEAEDYELIDSGNGRKLERFGPYVIERPAAQAAWRARRGADVWERADASFDRAEGNRWAGAVPLPKQWVVKLEGIRFLLSPTGFGHLGVFPEQSGVWPWIRERIRERTASAPPGKRPLSLLNLFAYSGGSTIAAAQAGAEVCHLDASHGMVDRAGENARLNGLAEAPIRWVVDDAGKFLSREIRRERRYDAVILDPPSFGRGRKGEVFKIHDHVVTLLARCEELLSEDPRFVLLTCHTPEYSPRVLQNLLEDVLQDRGGRFESGEMLIRGGEGVFPLPSGAFARWTVRAEAPGC
jgi:23S rRNA (cytosine1962-C5)-methyltransferase